MEAARSVNDLLPPRADVPSTAAVTVTGNQNVVNVAANSPGATQSATLTVDQRQQLMQLVDAFDQMRGAFGLDGRARAGADQVLGELRELAGQPTPDRVQLRQALERAKDVAVSGTGTAVGEAFVALVQRAAESLGLS